MISYNGEFLDSLVKDYPSCDKSAHARLIRHMIVRTFMPFMNGGAALELSCETGFMSSLIAPLFKSIDIVDGSEMFLNITRQRNIPNATYFCSMLEDFRPTKKYDSIFACHIIEHLLNVRGVLEMVKDCLKGNLFVAIPNARVISRQLARHMGIIDDLYKLTPNDILGGHQRVYDQVTLVKEIESAGFKIIDQGGIYFKPFADFQMDKLMESGIVGKDQQEGLYRLGLEYPQMCADSYVVATI